MDGVWVEKQRFDILLMSAKDFRKAYHIDVNHSKFGYSYLIPSQRYLTREASIDSIYRVTAMLAFGKGYDTYIRRVECFFFFPKPFRNWQKCGTGNAGGSGVLM